MSRNRFQNKVEASAFDSYDPGDEFEDVYSDRYDPNADFADSASDNGATTQRRVARAGMTLQINLSIANATASKITVELFNPLKSWTVIKKPELVIGNYLMIPFYSFEGVQALIANPTGGGVVGFNQLGNLEVRGSVGDPKLTVGCGEYPYHSLVESLKTLPMFVSSTRMTVTTDLQIDENITHFSESFGGALNRNVISPRAYFKPDQFQNKTLDILAGYKADSESGLLVPVLAGETVRFALFVQRWGKPTV